MNLEKLKEEVKKTLVLLIAIVIFAQPVHAQWDIDELIVGMDQFDNMIDGFCQGTDAITGRIDTGEAIGSAIDWICALQPSISRVRDLAEGASEDFTGFFTNAINSSFGSLADSVGFELGNTDLAGLINESVASIASGDFSIAEMTGKLLERVNLKTLQNLTAAPDADAPELEKQAVNAARGDPVRLEREVEAMERRTQVMMRSARGQDTTNMAQSIVATSLARGDEERLMRRVTNPNPAQGKPGTADTAQTRGKDANSSRAAIQAMVQAQADYMRQEAVSNANVVTALKEQAMQQVFTTQQVGFLAQSLSEEQMREYNEWRDEYYSELGVALAKAENVRSNFAVAIEILGGPE